MYPIRTGHEFISRGYKVYGLCTLGTQVADGMRESGIETYEISTKGALIASKLYDLNRWLVQRNVTIIHCHKSGDILISALLNLILKRKTFFTEHMGVKSSKLDLYHRLVYAHIERVFSISNETYKRNIKALPVPKEKISLLWLGTHVPSSHIEDLEVIKSMKSELSLPHDSFVIGNVGRVCSGKGQMELVEAFALLQEHYPDLQLVLVGGLEASEGSDNKFVQELKERVVELGLESRVLFTGFRKDTSRMLALMDIVCLPNHNEAFGLTAIEAMAAKKAIVGANTGALPEILEPVALLCNPLDPSSLAACIEKYIQNPKTLHENANLAFLRAKNEFAINIHVERLSQFYESK